MEISFSIAGRISIFAELMKRLAASILLLVYFTVTTGFAVSVNYCMNKRVSVEVGYHGHDDDDCGKCGMNIKKSGGCCGEEVKMIKLQLDQNLIKNLVADFSLAVPVPAHTCFYPTLLPIQAQPHFPLAHAPPSDKKDSYLRNCVFRL